MHKSMIIKNPIMDAVADGKKVSVFGLPFYSRMIALSGLQKLLYVCADFVKAKEAAKQFASIKDGVVFLPSVPDVLWGHKSSKEIMHQRDAALYKIASGECGIVVTSVQAFMQWQTDRDSILLKAFELIKNESIGFEQLLKKLIEAGYERVGQIEEPGQFSLKGDILDIWIIGQSPLRVDFFGDEIESIRVIDLDSFKAGSELEGVAVVPIQGIMSDGVSLLEFCNSVCVFDEAKQVVDNFNAHLTEHRNRFSTLFEKGEVQKNALDALNKDALKIESCKFSIVSFDRQLSQNRIFSPQVVLDLKNPELVNYAKDKQSLIDDVKMWTKRGVKVCIILSGALKQNLTDLFLENGVSIGGIAEGTLYKGGCFFSDDGGQIFIGYGDISYKQKNDGHTHTALSKKNKKAAFFQPKVGEPVVHDIHGVGICQGLERRNFNGIEKDFCIITYEGGDKLYVAVEGMSRLNAYAGSEDNVKLNKIGGADFARQKEKVKKSIKAFSLDLKSLYAQRETAKGHKYDPSNAALREFEQDFPYDETSCQLVAIEEGLNDLISGKIMDRLLCGDVGYGKTEVAMRLLYKVVLEGKQAAFIAPTTILAKQHFHSLKKRMERYGVNIGSLTRFDTPDQIKKTISGLKNGTIDIVCGTHRILSKDIEFKTLGMLVLDEEQRFGVADKDKIKTLKNDVNVLSLSATPIPRTLHMSMSGIRDISTLDTPPRGRIPISTYVSEYTESLVYDAITREIGRGGQAFIVYNRVEKIAGFASSICQLFPDLRIGVAHGQMKESVLEDTINSFILGEIDILIASTIIENGIDMPNANTMIIADADRLGLSQLYQLRGRIGRSDRLAYAFFCFDGSKVLTENAYKRLDAIAGYTDFGAGFKLAMRDLEIRGAGNVLGREQSGHMQRVGYDMYLKLIEEVMAELGVGGKTAGDSGALRIETKVNTDFSAVIGADYIEDIELRMREYKRVAGVDSIELATAELARLKDIYGMVPASVRNLVYVSLIKNLGEVQGASVISLGAKKMSIKFDGGVGMDLLKKAADLGFEFDANDNTFRVQPDRDALGKVIRLLGGSL